MSTATTPNDAANTHIGPAHHPGRTAGIIGAIVVLGGAMAGFYLYSARHETASTERLTRFQAVYTEHCNVKYSPDTSSMVKRVYLDSTQMQGVVDAQLKALDEGASCDSVARALRAADYPVPATP